MDWLYVIGIFLALAIGAAVALAAAAFMILHALARARRSLYSDREEIDLIVPIKKNPGLRPKRIMDLIDMHLAGGGECAMYAGGLRAYRFYIVGPEREALKQAAIAAAAEAGVLSGSYLKIFVEKNSLKRVKEQLDRSSGSGPSEG